MSDRVKEELVREWLPVRPADGHKGTFGRVSIFGGSVGMTGAPVLAARAAMRTGSGLVYVGVPGAVYPIVASMCLEAMASPLPGSEGRLSKEAYFRILERLSGCDAGLLGPGMGRSSELSGLVRRLLEQVQTPLVLDADALYAIREQKDVLKYRSEKGLVTILTPHEGEFAYLGGDVRGDREETTRAFAVKYGCILVRKGPGTLTAAPDGSLFLNSTGNNGMAKGGSGDVLAGMITSLLGQHLPPVKAAAAAVWLHGRAGDLAREDFGAYGLLPSDIIEKIPKAILPLEGWEA